MKTKTHTAIVETSLVSSIDDKHTYEVNKKLSNVEGEKAIIVLLYPTRSKENIYSDDNTLNYLVNHMLELNLNEIKIVNLFSQVVEGKLSAKGLQVDKDNLEYISSILKDKKFNDYKFVIAWGTSMATSIACQEAKRELLDLFKKANPKRKLYQFRTPSVVNVSFPHPLFLGIRGNKDIWELEEIKLNSITKIN